MLMRVRRNPNRYLPRGKMREILTLHPANQLHQVAGKRQLKRARVFGWNIAAQCQEPAHTKPQNQTNRAFQIGHGMPHAD